MTDDDQPIPTPQTPSAASFFLSSEDPKTFFALLEDAFAQYEPATDIDASIVTDIVRARWVLNRRQRTADAFEAALHHRKPDPRYWVPCELNEINLFDRYTAQADRTFQRSLKNMQSMQKINRDQQRWQQQLAAQKQRFGDETLFDFDEETEEETAPASPVVASASPLVQASAAKPPKFQQTLFIGLENGVTVVYEVTPSNDHIRRTISSEDQVLRTYNFVGAVPTEYQHLITPAAVTWGKSTSVQKTHSFDEWDNLPA